MAKNKTPYLMSMKAGEYWWCSCGESAKQPFCDGSHKSGGRGKLPLKVVLETAKKVAWCGCKKTKKPPFCDGTHARLRPDIEG